MRNGYLQLLELPGDALVLGGDVLVLYLVLPVRLDEVLAQLAVAVREVLLLALQLVRLLRVLVSPLPQHSQVVVQLLRVQLVQRFYLLEALLQVLNVRFRLDLYLSV